MTWSKRSLKLQLILITKLFYSYSIGVGKMASLLGRKKSYFSKGHKRDRFSELLIGEEETPFFPDCPEVPPHRRHMKKQVSFDSPPCAIKTITNRGIEDCPAEEVTLRSYQRDLMEFYKEQGAQGTRGSVPSVPIIPTLEVKIFREKKNNSFVYFFSKVMPPKPGSSRLSRKDKQGGWSLPKKEKI